jgi:hypothetical protein
MLFSRENQACLQVRAISKRYRHRLNSCSAGSRNSGAADVDEQRHHKKSRHCPLHRRLMRDLYLGGNRPA